jgi:hypothetical protein
MTRMRAVRPGTPPRLSVAELRRLAKRYAAARKSPPDARAAPEGSRGGSAEPEAPAAGKSRSASKEE